MDTAIQLPIDFAGQTTISVSSDQNRIYHKGILLTFFETKGVEKRKKDCRKCWMYRFTCSGVPCTPDSRKDGKNGIFSIRQMPKINN